MDGRVVHQDKSKMIHLWLYMPSPNKSDSFWAYHGLFLWPRLLSAALGVQLAKHGSPLASSGQLQRQPHPAASFQKSWWRLSPLWRAAWMLLASLRHGGPSQGLQRTEQDTPCCPCWKELLLEMASIESAPPPLRCRPNCTTSQGFQEPCQGAPSHQEAESTQSLWDGILRMGKTRAQAYPLLHLDIKSRAHSPTAILYRDNMKQSPWIHNPPHT